MSDELLRAHSLQDLGRSAEAVGVLRELIAREPEDPDAHCELALAQARVGDFEDALTSADRAAALDPTSEWAHRLRAITLIRLERAKLAVAAAEESVRLAPEEPLAHEVLADARSAAGDRRGARSAAEHSVSLQPERAGPWQTLAGADLEEERWTRAERHLRRALELDPEDAMCMNNLGVALQGQGRTQEANELFEAAARLNPELDIARENLASASRSWVNGTVALFALTWLGLQAVRGLTEGGTSGIALGVIAGSIMVVGCVTVARRRRRRVQSLSPVARRLIAEQSFTERTQIRRWRPIFWFIPSPIYLVLGLILSLSAVRAVVVDGPDVSGLVFAAVVLAGTAYAAVRSRRYVRRKGWFQRS